MIKTNRGIKLVFKIYYQWKILYLKIVKKNEMKMGQWLNHKEYHVQNNANQWLKSFKWSTEIIKKNKNNEME